MPRRRICLLVLVSLLWPLPAVRAEPLPLSQLVPLTATPLELIEALTPDETVSRTLTIANTGAVPRSVHLTLTSKDAEQPSFTTDYRLLVVAPQPSTEAATLITVLEGMDDVTYGCWAAQDGTPTVNDLLAWDAVLVGNGALWEAAGIASDGLGNALADYIDLGGKVIDTQLVQASGDFGLTGRYLAAGYAPVSPASGRLSGARQIDMAVPGHALVKGLSALTVNTPLVLSPVAGAVVPARVAGTDTPFLAANDDVVFINAQFFGRGAWGTGDLAALLRNTLHWLCGEREPWLSVAPKEALLGPGDMLTVTVTLSTVGLSATQVLLASLDVSDSAGGAPMLTIPIELAVLNDLNMGRLGGVVSANRPAGPFPGAVVQAQPANGSVQTCSADEHGRYRFWLTPGVYEVRVTVPDYQPVAQSIIIAPQGRSTYDVPLIHDAPWLRLADTHLAAREGGPQTLMLQLANDGVRPLDYALAVKNLPAWVSATPSGGQLAPGESAMLTFPFDSSAALPGWNVARLALITNDPWQSPDALMLYLQTGHAVMMPALSRLGATDAHPPDGQLD
ncbi:MAG: carboxypeptidase-like regulatory domain-containing protein [Anaerolineales bacterium]